MMNIARRLSKTIEYYQFQIISQLNIVSKIPVNHKKLSLPFQEVKTTYIASQLVVNCRLFKRSMNSYATCHVKGHSFYYYKDVQ